MRILHLSDTQLSGSPIRIVDLLNEHSEMQARHIVWNPTHSFRAFKLDMVGCTMPVAELRGWLDWADVISYHNRWKRQEIFKSLKTLPPKKPSVIQIHSPRESEDFSEEVASQLPIACVAQYHVRQWEGLCEYIVPNVVDITAAEYVRDTPPMRTLPVVSYAPSNWNAKGWDDKSYSVVAPILKRLGREHELYPQIITNSSHKQTMLLKRSADIGVDEISTGSYHLSSLEYLALGVPCFANIDAETFKVLSDLTGCESVPWVLANRSNFQGKLAAIIKEKSWQDLGAQARAWMEKYWSAEILVGHYRSMYQDLK